MTDTQEAPLIVAGMHRSGTSLAASILHAGGINMGERLKGSHAGNVRGHFENEDFVNFHREVLVRQRLHEAGWVSEGFTEIPPEQTERARGIIAQSTAARGPAGWGWKDPRTTLFLPFWNKLLPGARFLFLYRAPWEVADSIFRRASDLDRFFRVNPMNIFHVWRHYNALLLSFMELNPGRCLLVSSDAVLGDAGQFVRTINERFGMRIAPPPADIVAPELMKRDVSGSTRPQLVARTMPNVLDMLERLQAAAVLPCPKLDGAELQRIRESEDLSDSFRDWFDRYQLWHLISQPGQRGPAGPSPPS